MFYFLNVCERKYQTDRDAVLVWGF